MSLRLEMLQVARLAPRLLDESCDLVRDFLRSQINSDGGFQDRSGKSDLYYTIFGLEGLMALQTELPVETTARYLRTFGDGLNLDFVHLCCLARSWASLPSSSHFGYPREAIRARIEAFRSADGGYNLQPNCDTGTIYSSFLAYGACQDLGLELPDSAAILESVQSLRAEDGGYANQANLRLGLTPSTAAAATLLRNLGAEIDSSLGEWLLDRHRDEGGFYATPIAPIPDLLSTATALHALSGLKVNFDHIKDPCLDFIDTLWTSRGAFYGHWMDDIADCEYTYYAVLALGHLSLSH